MSLHREAASTHNTDELPRLSRARLCREFEHATTLGCHVMLLGVRELTDAFLIQGAAAPHRLRRDTVAACGRRYLLGRGSH